MKNHSSRKFVLAAITALALVASALQAQAQNATVTFNFKDLTKNVATDTITGSDSSTTLNLTTNNGVLCPDSPSFVDASLSIFTRYNGDTVSFTFNQTVTLESFVNATVGVTDADDNWSFRVGSENWVTETFPAGMTFGVSYEFNNKLTVQAGSTLQIRTNNPNNAGTNTIEWKSLTVTVVPEPASYALLLGFGAFLFIMIRHRIRR